MCDDHEVDDCLEDARPLELWCDDSCNHPHTGERFGVDPRSDEEVEWTDDGQPLNAKFFTEAALPIVYDHFDNPVYVSEEGELCDLDTSTTLTPTTPAAPPPPDSSFTF
jgi:hypothetical protein